MKYLSVILFVYLFTYSSVAASSHADDQPVVVATLDELRETIKRAKPGWVIEIPAGKFTLKRDLELKRLQGTPDTPITIRAQQPLQTEFSGDHIIKIRDSQHFVLEGFRFTLKSDVHGKSGALSVRNCHHCRITGNDFQLDETGTDDKNQTWLTIDGESSGHHRVDHNRFASKTKKGHYLFITGEDDFVSQHDVIQGNHFVDRGYGNDQNEYETIRVGESNIGNVDGKSHTKIIGNLFQRCQGEDEIVSLKVGGCLFLDNTVINCHGSVVFRDGSDGVCAGNFFLNTYTDHPFAAFRAGGVRFYGSGHRVYNNYFEGLDGTSLKAPLAIMHGAPAGSGALGVADGLPATDCVVVHNTWVRCSQLRLGHASKKRPLPPQNCEFSNNIVFETKDSQLLQLYEADGIRCRNNLLLANRSKETGIEKMNVQNNEFMVVDPKLKKQEGIYRLASGSPAIDAAHGTFDFVQSDINAIPRDEQPDIGADEFRPNWTMRRKPLIASEVGPGDLQSPNHVSNQGNQP